MIAATSAARRNAVRRVSLVFIIDAIAKPSYRTYQRYISGAIDFQPQPADVRLNDGGFGIQLQVPDLLKEHRSCDDAAAIPQQDLKHTKFAWLQMDNLARPFDFPFDQIDFKVGNLE